MVATRRAQASATPPTTPSAERHLDIQSAPASTKKMSKELRRLTIDANPSLGGASASSSSASAAKRGTRRSGMMRQELLADETQSLPDTAPLHLLPDGGVLLTPSPSDSPNSPHVAVATERIPSPPAVTQPQTSNPQPSTESPALTAKSAGKRKITQYFTAVPQQQKNNKRRKIDHDHLDPPTLQNTASAPKPPVAAPATLPTAASAPELKSKAVQESDQTTSNHVANSVMADNVVQAVHVPQQDKEPDKPNDTDQEQLYITAEESHDQEDAKKKEEEEKKALKRERELKRLQIDAKPALIDKRSRRQTTLPPTRPADQDAKPAERQRASLPATAIAGPSSAAANSTQEPAHVPEEVIEEVPDVDSIAQALAVPPEPNPPVFPAGTDPKLLASGEVNDEWLTKWLGYVAHITGDEDTSKILTEEDAKELIKPDRSDETQQDRQKRISNELDMVAGWNVVEQQQQQEAAQSSPEADPGPVKPPVKKKKQRFNPKPKGQPYIPKAKRKAQELAAKKMAKKKAEAEAAEARLAQEAQEAHKIQEPQEATLNGVTAEKETEAASESMPERPAAVQDAEASTDWLTDLMNATEPIVTEEEQAKKTKKSAKGKGKAKVV